MMDLHKGCRGQQAPHPKSRGRSPALDRCRRLPQIPAPGHWRCPQLDFPIEKNILADLHRILNNFYHRHPPPRRTRNGNAP